MIYQLSQIKYRKIPRISTEIDDFDWLLGGEGENWGIPQGKISLWYGPPGTGKSRTLIDLSLRLSSKGKRILYFQNETDLSDFRSWIGDKPISPTFYASKSCTLKEQKQEIIESQADVIIVDSINQIKEFGNNKSSLQEIFDLYKYLTEEQGVHIMFVCQVTTQGLVRGGTVIKHLADIEIEFNYYYKNKIRQNGHYTLNIPTKNRCGKTGDNMTIVWQHSNDGVKCISNNRLYDNLWCASHNIPVNEAPLISNRIPPYTDSRLDPTPIFDDISKTWFYGAPEKKKKKSWFF